MNKRFNDTVELSNGLKLYVDPKYNEFENRVNEAEIVSAPCKFDTGAKPGDTLYFHHHVVVNDGQPITGEENSYLVNYSEEAMDNQAIAYRPKGSENIIPLGGWIVLEPVKEEKKKESEIIEVIKLQEDPIAKGRVAYHSDSLKEINLKVGDVVGFNHKFGYRFKIDGEVYLRIRLIDLLYVENN
jgi:co-chaperonin GroES (HSP10)